MRINDITLQDIKHHLRIDNDEDDLYLADKLEVAKDYIKDFTGLTESQVSSNVQFGEVALNIITDLYENRGATVDSKESIRINKIYDSMLSMHSINLL